MTQLGFRTNEGTVSAIMNIGKETVKHLENGKQIMIYCVTYLKHLIVYVWESS